MEKQTILCTALPNGRDPDGSLRLSVYISPRLWSDDAPGAKLKLSQFPDWLTWPSLVGVAGWSVTFDGQPPVNATVKSGMPRLDLWQALFKTDTDVLPFLFEDLSDAKIKTIDSGLIHDTLAGLYARAATDPTYGAGRDLPAVEILAGDPDLQAIARPSEEEVPPRPGPRPPPVDVGGTAPRPDENAGSVTGPERSPEERPRGCGGYGCGCLLLPLTLLGRLFPRLEKWLDQLFGMPGGLAPSAEPALEKPVATSWPLPTAGISPTSPPVIAPDPPANAPHSTPGGPPSAKREAFDDLKAFVTAASEVSVKMPGPAKLEEIYDFHAMISTLGDYPKLLRLLGLVVDLRIEVAGGDPAGAGTVKVQPALALSSPTTLVSPRTRYALDASGFLATPQSAVSEISNGLLRFNDPARFRVIQVDAVGGGLKLQNAATNSVAFARPADRAPNMPDNAGLPALRTGGISIIRRDYEAELREAISRSLALQLSVSALDGSPAPAPGTVAPPAPTDEVFAEDLVRGYRVDVYDTKSKAWHSLCQRSGTYLFLDAPAAAGGIEKLLLEDEGFVQFSATQQVSPTTTPEFKTGDSLFVWDGWSLAAPRPGLTIMPDVTPDHKAIVAAPPNEPATKFKLKVDFKPVTGSLPRLRFEYQYRLRARVCDLAGNSVFDPSQPDFAQDSAEQTPLFDCARYEPVSPPAMLLREEPIEGESVERLVVRSPAVAGEPQVTDRHIIPPKVSQLMAELHGKFDTPFEVDGSLTGYTLATRESGALTKIATEVKKDIWVHAGAQVELPYLPDPSSRGAVLLNLPGLGATEIVEPTVFKIANKVPFSGAWPHLDSFRLRLVAIDAGVVPAEPDWNGLERVLTVQLPQAEQRVVRLNSYLTESDFARQGVAQWTQAEAPAGFAEAKANTVAGQGWLHLPWRELTLVHAVQKPLEPAQITTLTPDKQTGKTFVMLTGDVSTHAASTGKVDVLAEWTDPIDDPKLAAPTTRDHGAHVLELMIPVGSPLTTIPPIPTLPKPIQEFGDTKFHEVKYTSVASSRFREYFPPELTKDPGSLTTPNPVPVVRNVLNSARPDAPRVLYVVPSYEWRDVPQPPGNSHRVRRGGGLRVYIDRPWYSSGAGELLGVVFLPDVPFLQLSEKERKFVTHWGADPIWASPPAADHARLKNFDGIVAKDEGLSLPEFDKLVAVAGYPVEFDKARQLWFADIQMEVGPAYMPFVRLALVRYQPESTKDCHLSDVVRAEFGQLAPERSASLAVTSTPTGAKMEITVKGPTYTGSSVTKTTEGLPDLFGKESPRKGLAEIEALLQRRNPDFGDAADLGWDTIQTELLTQNPGDPGAWQGIVELAQPIVPGKFRILVKEYEWYRTDFQDDEAKENVSLARRVVYADTMLLG